MKIGIIGLGLIGGSIAKALKKINKSIFIAAIDTNDGALSEAISQGVIDERADNYAALKGCDVIFVAAPCHLVAEIIAKLYLEVGEAAIITDVASVKGKVRPNFENIRFIGGHPMAGTEGGGYISSREYMFENAYYVLTGDENSDDYKAVEALVLQMRAIPVNMTESEHDIAVSKISHLPHMIAYSLVETSIRDNKAAMLAAGGFKDITRIASSDPKFWSNVAMMNGQNIVKDIDEFILKLQTVRKFIAGGQERALRAFFESGKAMRDGLAVSKVSESLSAKLKVEIEDKVGMIKNITCMLAENNINIANINIENSREGESGALTLSFFDKKSAERAREVLRKGGVKCSDF